MLASSLLVLALASVGAQAIMVTYPTKRDTWSTSGAQTITWDSVATDPSSFSIVLVNQDSSYLAKTVSLNDNVSTSDGKTTVTFPGGDFPAGKSFQVNFLRNDRDDSILAQSPMFDIDQSTAAATTTTAAQTTTKAATTAAATTGGAAPKTLSAAVQSVSAAVQSAGSSASASAESASESGGVSIPSGNTNGALSSLSSSALLVAVAGVVGAAALF